MSERATHRLRLAGQPLARSNGEILTLSLASQLKVLLINPPQTYPAWLAEEFQSYWPMGLAMIAAVLERAGARVRCIDCLAYETWSRNGAEVTFGLPRGRLRAEIEAFEPDIVGLSNPFTAFIEDSRRIAKLVKQVNSRIQVVLGGIEASLPDRNRLLLEQCPDIDVLVKSEGEVTVLELLSRYDLEQRGFRQLSAVPGLLFRSDEGIVETRDRPFLEDLDALPLPAYHLFDLTRMFDNRLYARYRGRRPGQRCLPIHTSRGCPYSCSFCSVHSQVGKAYRRHGPEYVRRHLQTVRQAYGVQHVHFEDDNLTLHRKHSMELFAAIEDVGITWDTPNGTRADSIDEALAAQMVRAGARSVSIAVESGNQDVLDRVVRKRLDLSDARAGLRNLHAAGLPTFVFLIIGFPGETEADVRDTLAFGRSAAVDYGVSNLVFVATPLPGTPLERECRSNGYLLRDLNGESLLSAIRLNQAPLIQTPTFSKGDLYAWAKSELDREPIHTIGRHIPMFFAKTPRGIASAQSLMGVNFGDRLPPSYWSGAVRDLDPMARTELERKFSSTGSERGHVAG